MAEANGTALSERKIDLTNTLFIGFVHCFAIGGVAYSALVRFSWWTVGLALLWAVFSGVSITGGYHRLFSHRTYQSHPLLKAFYLIFGAAAVQNSALKWSLDHRQHHAYTDREGDPYNIKRGFWWAHIGWVLHKEVEPPKPIAAEDLQQDRMVYLQHRYYVPLAVVMNIIIPMAIATLWGDALGALFWVAGIRLVVLYHATFSINSVAHVLGRQPYSVKDSARDSAITALISMGEGYHNFHHRFPTDYRNGVRFYHFDPTKWWIYLFSKIGVTWNLKRTSKERIEDAKRLVREAQRAVA